MGFRSRDQHQVTPIKENKQPLRRDATHRDSICVMHPIRKVFFQDPAIFHGGSPWLDQVGWLLALVLVLLGCLLAWSRFGFWFSSWLLGWLVGWLDGWMVGWLAGWLAGWRCSGTIAAPSPKAGSLWPKRHAGRLRVREPRPAAPVRDAAVPDRLRGGPMGDHVAGGPI